LVGLVEPALRTRDLTLQFTHALAHPRQLLQALLNFVVLVSDPCQLLLQLHAPRALSMRALLGYPARRVTLPQSRPRLLELVRELFESRRERR